MSHNQSPTVPLVDWYAMDADSQNRMWQARNALSLLQDLLLDKSPGANPSIQVGKDEIIAFLSLIIEQLDTAEAGLQRMRDFLDNHADAIAKQNQQP